MFWAIVTGAILIAVGLLLVRDRKLKRRMKTEKQIRAASEANVASYSGIRGLGVGLLLIIGAVADYVDKGAVTVRVVALLLIGLALLGFGVGYLRKAYSLQKVVDSEGGKGPV